MKTGKRFLSLLLSVIMALGVCAAAPVTASTSGEIEAVSDGIPLKSPKTVTRFQIMTD